MREFHMLAGGAALLARAFFMRYACTYMMVWHVVLSVRDVVINPGTNTQSVGYFAFDAASRQRLNQINTCLERYGAYSVSYNLYLPRGVQIKNSINNDLLLCFLKNDFNNNCPVLKVCRSLKNTVVVWNLCNGSTKKELNIMGMRRDFGLYNGITIASSFGGIQELVGWASTTKDHDLSKMAMENIYDFYSCILRLRAVAIKSSVLPLEI